VIGKSGLANPCWVKGCQIVAVSRAISEESKSGEEPFIRGFSFHRFPIGLGTANTLVMPASVSTPCQREKWIVLAMLWWVCLFNYADRQAISSLFPLLEKDFGFSKVQLGLIGSAFMWVYAASAPLAGYAGDRMSRRGLILGGCFFWSLMTGFTGLCSKVWQFVAARSLIGLGESVYFPASASMLSDFHGEKTRSTALSFHQSAVYVGTIAGGWLGAVIAAHHGWRAAFYAFGGAGILLSLLLFLRLREKIGHDPARTHRTSPGDFLKVYARLLARPGVMALACAFACANGVAAVFLIWAPTFLFQKFGLGLVAAGFSAVAAIQLACAISAPISGLIADRLSLRMRGARMIIQAVALLLGILPVAVTGHTSSLTVLIVAMGLFGLCKGAYDGGIFASAFDLVPADHRGSTVGLMNLFGWGGGALGPLLVGFAAGRGNEASQMIGMSKAISWSALAYAVAALLILGALGSYRRTEH
jgi:MFS family permease